LQKFLFVVEIFTKYDRGLLFFAAPCSLLEQTSAKCNSRILILCLFVFVMLPVRLQDF